MGYRSDEALIIRVSSDKTYKELLTELTLYTNPEYAEANSYLKGLILQTQPDTYYPDAHFDDNLLKFMWEQVKGDNSANSLDVLSLIEELGYDALYMRIGDDLEDLETQYVNNGYELGYIERQFVV